MKNLHDPDLVLSLHTRLGALRTDSPRQWGTMTVQQMLAHCVLGAEMALGDRTPPRIFVGRLIGPLIKRRILRDDKPMMRNAPTAPSLVVTDQPELDAERTRLHGLIDRFASGPAACTTQPHPFFGTMTPDEWGILAYKHLDHHLRQFGV